MIPLFIIEEHHEAFGVWIKAVKKKIISTKQNVLLHVDQHSDMNIPGPFKKSIKEKKFKLERKINKFVFKELNISNFILAAVYLKIFNRIIWFNQEQQIDEDNFISINAIGILHDLNIKEKRCIDAYIRSYNQKGKQMIVGLFEPAIHQIEDPDRNLFTYHYTNIAESIDVTNNIILDIDLDYFSCIDNPYWKYELKTEISKKTFEKLKKSNYLKLKLLTNNKFKKIKKKYFIKFDNQSLNYRSKWKVSKNEILSRIDNFIAYLHQNNIKPLLITICRSRYSGYTPKNQWRFIEKNLINKLNQAFNIEIET